MDLTHDNDWWSGVDLKLSFTPEDIFPQLRKPVKAQAKSMRMRFGKYKGKLVSEVPVGYLRWLLKNVSSFFPSEKEEMQRLCSNYQ